MRLTVHPASDQALGWTADGKVLFRSRRDHPHGDYRVYTIPPTGRDPADDPARARGVDDASSPAARGIALQKIGLEFHNWKRYKGGEAEDIWVGTLVAARLHRGHEVRRQGRLPDVGGRRADLLRHRPLGTAEPRVDAARRQRRAAADPLRRLRRALARRWATGRSSTSTRWTSGPTTSPAGRTSRSPVQLPSDRLQVRERFVDPMPTLRSWSLSKDGERIVLEARGDVFVARTQQEGPDPPHHREQPRPHPDSRLLSRRQDDRRLDRGRRRGAARCSTPPTTAPRRRHSARSPPGWHFRARLVARRQVDRLGRREAQALRVRRGHRRDHASSTAASGRSAGTPGRRTAATSPTTIDLPNLFSPGADLGRAGEEGVRGERPAFNSVRPAWDPEGEVPLLPLRPVHQPVPRPRSRPASS